MDLRATVLCSGVWRKGGYLPGLTKLFRQPSRRRFWILSQTDETKRETQSVMTILRMAGYVNDHTRGKLLVLLSGRGSSRFVAVESCNGCVLDISVAPGIPQKETLWERTKRVQQYDLILEGFKLKYPDLTLIVLTTGMYNAASAGPVLRDKARLPIRINTTMAQFCPYLNFGDCLACVPALCFRSVRLPFGEAFYRASLSVGDPVWQLDSKRVSLVDSTGVESRALDFDVDDPACCKKIAEFIRE